MYIKLKKVHWTFEEYNYYWMVTMKDEDDIETVPKGFKYTTELGPIKIIVHGREYEEWSEGWIKRDAAYIKEEILETLY